MEKTPARPRWGLVRTYTARALGSGGLESARHFFNLNRIVFGNLYQTAHSEWRWKSGITRLRLSGNTGPSLLPQQLRQLGDVGGDAPGIVILFSTEYQQATD